MIVVLGTRALASASFWQRSRDPKDDPVLACALAARADYLIRNDRDLLTLGTPFGIAIVTPAEFLRTVGQTSS